MSDNREAVIERAHTLFCQMSTAKKGLAVALDYMWQAALAHSAEKDAEIERLKREKNDAVSMMQGIARRIQAAYPHQALAAAQQEGL